MPISELDDLLAMFGGDADTMRQLIDKNPTARQRLADSTMVYKALVANDQDTLNKFTEPARVTPPAAVAAAVTPPAAAATPALTLDEILAAIETRNASRYVPADKLDEEVSRRAKAALDAEAGNFIGRAMGVADEVYTLRTTYEREFGKPFDRKAFEEFATANAGKFSSLTAAFDAMVQEDRIAARIAKGIDEGRAAEQTTKVPGNSLVNSTGMIGAMIRKNNPQEVQRGDAIDNAASAFRKLRAGQVN